MKFHRTDAQSILSQIKRQEKEIKIKRRWLLGVPSSKSERKKLKKNFKNRYLSESLLREDDMFYESVRSHVEDALGAHRMEQENHVSVDDMHLMQIPNMKRAISSCLDNLTTKGLYLLAMIITGNSVKFEVTRCNLKRIIRGSLSSFGGIKNHNHHQLETRKQLFLFLTNPQHFRESCEPFPALRSQSYRVAVANMLLELQNLSSQTLIAMRRKLKGVKAPIPQLQPCKHGWTRDHLIKLVKKISREMLSQLSGEDELQEPLAKAMAVADLSLKLTTDCQYILSKEFYQFSPEVKSLQRDIMNAIWSVKEVVTLSELRNLQLLIEPKAVISNRSLRTAFVNFLTEFLFECSDMDCIPKSLLQILDVINKGSNISMHDVSFKRKYIEEEIECILNMSASTKQIVWDLLPDDQFDQDFTDAYMEQLEESDDSSSDEDDKKTKLQEDIQFRNATFGSTDSNYEAESIGDSAPFLVSDRSNNDSEKLPPNHFDTVNLESKVHDSPHKAITDQCQGESTDHICTLMASRKNDSSLVSPDRQLDQNFVKRLDFNESYAKTDPNDTSNLFCDEKEPIRTGECKNQYLATQDACDKTSILAYNLIGHMLKEFSIIEVPDLNLSKSLYLSGDKSLEDEEDTKAQSSSSKHAKAFVDVIEELIPSFPDSSMEKLKMLMGLDNGTQAFGFKHRKTF